MTTLILSGVLGALISTVWYGLVAKPEGHTGKQDFAANDPQQAARVP